MFKSGLGSSMLKFALQICNRNNVVLPHLTENVIIYSLTGTSPWPTLPALQHYYIQTESSQHVSVINLINYVGLKSEPLCVGEKTSYYNSLFNRLEVRSPQTGPLYKTREVIATHLIFPSCQLSPINPKAESDDIISSAQRELKAPLSDMI